MQFLAFLVAGWELTSLPGWELELIQTSCWECGTDIFFQQQRKITKKHKMGCIIIVMGSISSFVKKARWVPLKKRYLLRLRYIQISYEMLSNAHVR